MSNDWDFDMEVVEDKTDMQTGAVEKGDSSSTSRNLDDLPEIERVPDGWELDTIEGVAEDVLGGGTPSKSNEDYWGGKIPWASVKDLDGVAVQDTEDYITEEGIENSATNLISSGSVVISTRMTVGEAFLNLVDMAINQDLKAIKPDDSRVNTRFLVYALRGKDRYLKSLGRGTTVSGITTADLKRTHFARPPLPEQRKIASVLYAVDQAIQKTEEIIEQAKRVKRGLMQDLFETGYYDHSICERRIGPQLRKVPESWDVIGIGELAEYQNGYGFSKDEWSEQGRPIIRIQDLTRPEESDVNYFDGQVDEKYEVENGDILVSWSATLGVFKWNRGSAVLNQHIFKVRNIKKFVNEGYLYYALNYALSELERKLHGSTMKHVTRSAFENTEVPLPGLDEQKTISRVLGSVDEEIRTEEAKKQNLEQVKKGLMQDLLTGEVRTMDKAIEVLGEVKAHG
jgi:type I restriction enzyme S subunit